MEHSGTWPQPASEVIGSWMEANPSVLVPAPDQAEHWCGLLTLLSINTCHGWKSPLMQRPITHSLQSYYAPEFVWLCVPYFRLSLDNRNSMDLSRVRFRAPLLLLLLQVVTSGASYDSGTSARSILQGGASSWSPHTLIRLFSSFTSHTSNTSQKLIINILRHCLTRLWTKG